MLISTKTPHRNMQNNVSHISGHHGPTKLKHKMNRHRWDLTYKRRVGLDQGMDSSFIEQGRKAEPGCVMLVGEWF